MTCSEKLKDPRWQKKRLEIMQRDNFSCYWCGDNKSTLNVHHQTYVGKNPWDSPDECLITLCEDCHSVEHLPINDLESFLFFCVRVSDRFNLCRIKNANSAIRNLAGR